MTILKRGLLVLTLLGLAACYPLTSKYPLGGQKMDSALLGTWLDDDDETEMVMKRKDRKTIHAILRNTEDTEEPSAHYLIKPSQINGKAYMSITQVFPKSNIEDFAKAEEISFREAKRRLQSRAAELNGYYLGYYTITDDEDSERLQISLIDMDNEVVAADIAEGRVAGGMVSVKNEDGEEDEILHLTSSSGKLTDYVASYDEDPLVLFDFEIIDMVRK